MGREVDLRGTSGLAQSNQVQVQSLNLTPPAGFVLQNERGNFTRRATDLLQSATARRGQADSLLGTAQPAEFAPDPIVQRTSSGARVVNLQQRFKDIRIFQQSQTVRFSPADSLNDAVGSIATVADDLPVTPKCTPEEAVLVAAKQVATPADDERVDAFGQTMNLHEVSLDGFQPRVVAAFVNYASVPTVLEAGPFGAPFKANLLWFPINGALRLTWEVIVTMPKEQGQFRVVVDTDTKTVLYCKQLMHSILARGNVYSVDGGQGRQLVDFPRKWSDYGLNDGLTPAGADKPPDWVDESEGNSTGGNYVLAQLGEVDRTFSGAVQQPGLVLFNPSDPQGDDQKILNIFYFNCYMHDYFYLLGFREADGNFQRNNNGNGGLPGDRVDARAYSGPVWGTANMLTPVDGQAPRMNMGLFTGTQKHTAFDSTVVFHEFTHGVTNRLVGGPANDHALEEPQSKSMGEGWGDYFACTINKTDVVGKWVTEREDGIRLHRYTNYPNTFADVGTGAYTEVHNIGEIWCATLLEMNRQLVTSVGDERRGISLAVQLVVDALKLSPANPNFLQMRDAILLALDHMAVSGGSLRPPLSNDELHRAKDAIWKAFAHYKMGAGAKSINGSDLSGIVPDESVPGGGTPGPAVTPAPSAGAVADVKLDVNQAIPDGDPAGISSVIAISQSGTVGKMTVGVDISHAYVADLRIKLISPGGKETKLYDRLFSTSSDLKTDFNNSNTANLPIGESIQGNWQLNVADLSPGSSGTLNKWSLTLS